LLFSAGPETNGPVIGREVKMQIQRLLWVGVLILAGINASDRESVAQAPLTPSTAPSVQGSGTTQSVVTQVQALAAQIASLKQDLAALLMQLEQLRASKPQPPPDEAPPAVKAAYANALNNWDNQMQSVEQRRQALQVRINELETQLARLASSKLPKAQQADVARLQAALAEAKQSMSQAVARAASLKAPPTKSGVIRGPGAPPASGLP
jgi:hypothetical protein